MLFEQQTRQPTDILKIVLASCRSQIEGIASRLCRRQPARIGNRGTSGVTGNYIYHIS